MFAEYRPQEWKRGGKRGRDGFSATAAFFCLNSKSVKYSFLFGLGPSLGDSWPTGLEALRNTLILSSGGVLCQ